MPTKEELQHHHLTELAVLCGKVADNTSDDSVVREKAQGMKEEWALLIQRETPPPPELRLQQEVEKQKESLKRCMVEFLAGVL